MSNYRRCLVKHMGKDSPIRAYRADMAEDVAELVDGGKDADAAWLEVIDAKTAELEAEQARIQVETQAAYDKAVPVRSAKAKPKPAQAVDERVAAVRKIVADETPGKAAPLYASRPVVNAQAIIDWAASQGFKSTLPAADLHVTVAYSSAPMDGKAVPVGAPGVSILGGKRTVEPLGDQGAVVLKFTSAEMSNRWQAYRDAGASWDYEGYTPHVTITYDGKGVDLSKVQPYTGPIELGAEKQEALDTSDTAGNKPKEAPVVAPAMHKDPGEPAEVVTPAVVEDAIKTAVSKTLRKPSAMKAELLAQIDAALTEAPDYGDYQAAVKSMGEKDAISLFTTDAKTAMGETATPAGYSRPKRTFKIEGDGTFTVNNTVRQLLRFRAEVQASKGFADKQARPGIARATDTLDRRSSDAAIRDMVDEGDMQAASDYAENLGIKLADVKLPKVLRDRLDKWTKDQESAARMAEWQKAQAEGKPAPGSLAAMVAEKAAEPAAAPAPAPAPKPAPAGIASQTFDQWVRASYAANEYRASYLEAFGGDENRATLASVVGAIDKTLTTAKLLQAAKQEYRSELFKLPREASISLDVWDALESMSKVEAQRHFYDLDGRITKRDQEATRRRVAEEAAKKAPYEAAFTEVDAEIRRLDKLPGPPTKKQNDLSIRRDRLREAIYQIGQGKEPDGRLLKASPPDAAAKSAAPAAETATVKDSLTPATPGKLDNFGEKLPPARRAMAAKLDEELADDDIATRPFSEVWPQAENDAIEDVFAAAVAHAARAEVPAKPRQPYKLKRWVEKVKTVRGLAGMIVGGRIAKDQFAIKIGRDFPTLKDWWSKVLLLERLPRDQWKRVGEVEERPNSFTYVDGKQVPRPLLRLTIDDKPHYLNADGTVTGNMAEIRALLEPAALEKRMEFEVRGPNGGPYKVNKKGDSQYRALGVYKTTTEARDAIAEYNGLVAAWEAVKASDNITERDLRTADNRPRAGQDWREGKDVTPEQFQERFGFKGGEFGKWVQQGKGDKERQALLNNAYDALMDLAQIAGIPPRAISLNGTLGIAFGSRGSGWASAHFEPSNLVINLTKTRGAGALAHEWFHAADNYFSRMRREGQEAKFTGSQADYRTNNFITHKPEALMVPKSGSRYLPPMTRTRLEAEHARRKDKTDAYNPANWQPDPAHPKGVRPEVEQRFADLVQALNDSPMTKRAMLLDGNKTGNGYWSQTLERAARAFESYVIARMHEDGYHNDFLVNVRKSVDTGKSPERYPYLLPGEIKPVADAFGALFDTIQTRTDDAGNVAMFSRFDNARGISMKDAEAVAATVRAMFPKAPPIFLHENTSQVRADVQRAIRAAGAENDAEAMYHRGEIHVFINNLPDVERALFVIGRHEIRHAGMAAMFPTSQLKNQALLGIALKNPALMAEAKARVADGRETSRATAIEEALADMPVERLLSLSGIDRLISKVRQWLRDAAAALRKKGYATLADAVDPKTWTDKDVAAFVLRAENVSRAGGGMQPADGGTMFSRTPRETQDRNAEKAAAAESKALGKALTDNNLRAARLHATNTLSDWLGKSLGTTHWWHKTVGTPYNLAMREPQFKPVYDAIQTFLNDVSHYAAESANLAPTILPKLESIGDVLPAVSIMGKKFGKSAVNPADAQATAAPVFEGTLAWGRDEDGRPVKTKDLEARAATMSADEKATVMLQRRLIDPRVLRMWQGLPLDQYEMAINTRYQNEVLKPGVVWTDSELRSLFSLTPEQIGLYREFRAATDKSLDDMAISAMLRVAGEDAMGMRAQALASGNINDVAEMLRDLMFELAEQPGQDPKAADSFNKAANGIIDIADRVQDLKDRGYAPLSRFGHLTLDVTTPEGERVYFGMFETDRERRRMARKMEGNFPDATIEQGTVSEEQFKQFAGVTPETLELFADVLGLTDDSSKDALFQDYLRKAKANRSGLKRLIHRKGVPGFSEDIGRVLASFVYSNARQTSSNLHVGAAEKAIEDISQKTGQLKDYAIRLNEYVKNPQEEAQALRSVLFAQFLGGSLASAMVNATQPFMVTFPYLSQFGGVYAAEKQMARALADVGRNVFPKDKGLTKAMADAIEDGIVAPQEVYFLQAQASGKGQLKTGDGTVSGWAGAKASNTMSRLATAWGKPFSYAELFNRRLTFIAAYRTAVDQGMPNPAQFARDTIAATQFTYNKGNRPQWARGATGAVLFTFRTYSVSMVELMSRSLKSPEGRRAALAMLAMIVLVAGVDGLPFMEDMEDVIDGFAQRVLDKNWSTKYERNRLIALALMAVFGDRGGLVAADFVAKGLTGLPGSPIDVSGRLGLHNLIPGTGIFLKKDAYQRDVAELAGPAGSLTQRMFEALGQALAGDPLKAAITASPIAVQNVAKAVEMERTGFYPDTKGRMVVKTTTADAVAKGVGFQPGVVKRTQDMTFEQARLVGMAKQTESEIVDAIAKGIVKQDEAAQKAGWERLAKWNIRNPETPIKITPEQVLQRKNNMTTEKTQRMLKTTPRELRPGVSEAFNREKALQE